MSFKSAVLTAISSLIIVFVIVAVGSQPSQNSEPWDVNNISADNLVEGVPKDELTDVNIVEYFDLQCPACAFFHDHLQKAKQEFAGQIRITYRNFPLSQIHQFAQASAEALEGLEESGANWRKFMDTVYRNQKDLGKEKIIEWASQAGGKPEEVVRWLDEGTYRQAVLDDLDSGKRAGVEGTPTIFINGEKFAWQDYSQLQAKIKSLIENSESKQPQ